MRLLPFSSRDRALLVGVGYDQAGIHRKSFAADQSGRIKLQGRARTRDETCRSRGIAHDGHARTPSDLGSCPRSRARKTGDRRGLPVPRDTAPVPSGSRTRSRQRASGSSAPDQSRADPSSGKGDDPPLDGYAQFGAPYRGTNSLGGTTMPIAMPANDNKTFREIIRAGALVG